MKNRLFTKRALLLTSIFLVGLASKSDAQDCYSSSGCSDYTNFGYNSATAATLEYDNYISAFHSTAVRDLDGTLKIWGEMTQADGMGAYLMPTPINPGNYPGLTGQPLKIALGSGTIDNVQFILLTDDDKLWTWGVAGIVLHTSLTTNTSEIVNGATKSIAAFQELSIGLPVGVTASDIKMMFATYNCLILTTCDGEVFSLVQYWANTGNGSTSSGTNVWNKVVKSTAAGGGDLSGIVAARGCSGGFIALDTAGHLWTWGAKTWDGVAAPAQRSAAVPVVLPDSTADVKMIGMTGSSGGSGNTAVYVLYENGNIYTLGDNNFRQLGNWTTANSQTWVQPRYTSATGAVMDDVVWMSPIEHDNIYRAINILTEDKKIFNWGQENKSNLGRGVSDCSAPSASLDPGEPTEFTVGYDNSSIFAVETGGHTTMALRECESDFGYVGHRINGSMGDNNDADECDNEYQFATSAVSVCGAVVVDAVLNSTVEGPYYVGNSLTLLADPTGGTYAISTLSTGTATLTDSVLLFTGAGTVRVDYTAPSITCSTVTVSKTFNVTTATEKITIPGNIWNDADGDAVMDAGENGLSNDIWVNLTNPDGIIIASVKVNADGTYQFDISTADVGLSGSYSVVLTNKSFYKGDLLTTADTLAGGYEYTGTNLGGIADVSNNTGILNIGDLSTITTTTITAAANFGIQQPPTADAKEYSVSNDAFTNTPPAGFPDISSPGDVWQAIPMSSSALTGTTGGALSGSDPEDCPTASSCSDGATFNIETINSNTRLFYDFGGATGVVEIDVTGSPVEIENFDVTKMVIWGQDGSGAAGDEIGFTYSITDQAGTLSNPVSYTIETATPLPIELLSFVAKLQNSNVLLNWATASEVNNKGFEIERSATGYNWSNIGFVGAATADGNSNAIQNYSFRDSKPSNGMNYYRLKQLDINGKFNYSPVRPVTMQQQASIAIQPNPAKDHIIIKGLAGNETIKIYSTHGRLVKEIVAAGNTAIIALDELNAGMYHVNVVSASGVVFVSKVIKL